MSIHTSTILFSFLSCFSWIVLSYEGYAIQKGWPVGEMFRNDTSMIKIASFIGLPGSAIAASILAAWWSGIIVLIIGFILALIMTNIFRHNIQPIAILGLVVFWITGIIILSQY